MSEAPTIYDHAQDAWRPVTQQDVDVMLQRLGEAALLKNTLLTLLGLPLNAAEQVEKLAELGGLYGMRDG